MRTGMLVTLVALFGFRTLCDAAPTALSDTDVAGVRVGMTTLQARTALHDRFPNATVTTGSVDCVADRLAVVRSRYATDPQQRCAGSLNVRDDIVSVGVSLIEDYPAHPGVSRVYGVRYEQSDLTPTAADSASFKATLQQRFGSPASDLSEGNLVFESWGEPVKLPLELPGTHSHGYLAGTITGEPSKPFLVARIGLGFFPDAPVTAAVDLYDAPFVLPRDRAIRAAYAAVIPAPLKTRF
jgi:hypothetical protein